MSAAMDDTYDDEIAAFIRSRCIGFQRGNDRLIVVVENLVQPKIGPLTRVYQVESPGEARSRLLRHRPHIDIPAPSQRSDPWK